MGQITEIFSTRASKLKRVDRLSHYTDLQGFIGIIRTSELWASNILFLNDKEEMEFGIKVANKVVESLEKSSGRPSFHGRVTRDDKSNLPDVYACCFCSNSDMLSQWRGYGGSVQGVSIQFHPGKLAEMSQDLGYQLVEVLYGEPAAMTHLQLALKKAEERDRITRALIGSELADAHGFTRTKRKVIMDLAPRFKNYAFREEREFRIIVRSDAKANVQYRCRDNVLVPYVAIGKANGALPIESITVGPGKDMELTKKSIVHFLESTRFYKEVQVKISGIPFRQ